MAQPGKHRALWLLLMEHSWCLLTSPNYTGVTGGILEQRLPRQISFLERCLVGIQEMEIWW